MIMQLDRGCRLRRLSWRPSCSAHTDLASENASFSSSSPWVGIAQGFRPFSDSFRFFSSVIIADLRRLMARRASAHTNSDGAWLLIQCSACSPSRLPAQIAVEPFAGAGFADLPSAARFDRSHRLAQGSDPVCHVGNWPSGFLGRYTLRLAAA